MKKLLSFLLMSFVLTTGAFAQAKMAYVDTEYIMQQIPEYKSIEEEIDRISKQWQGELEQKYQEIEKLYNEYTKNEILYPEEVKKEKQEEIFEKERQAKEFREKKFGYNGELFQLQETKVKPIQDKLMKAVESVAKQKRVGFIFDKAGETTWLYTNQAYDLSKEVLEAMGVKKEGNSSGSGGGRER